MHRGWGKNNATPPLGTGRVLDRRSRTTGGGSGREVERDRQREEGTPIQDNPGTNRDLGVG